MTKPAVYVDHAATTPTRPEVLEAMLPFYSEQFGNPSSLHSHGRATAKALKQAKDQIAQILNADGADGIIFTSGGTESNNFALKGLAFGLQQKGRHIITSSIEHSAILEPCAWLESQGWEITRLPVDTDGFVAPEDLKAALRKDTVLVSIMHGNNEVGTLQPIENLGAIAHEHDVLFHTDAVQTIGKLAIDVRTMPIDLLSASGHKFYGPKGIGFLYTNSKAQKALAPWLHGGGQQNELRSGTENIPGIVGLSTALVLAATDMRQTTHHLKTLQDKLMTGIVHRFPGARINGPKNLEYRVPGNINVSFAPLEGEALVLRMDLQGISVSSGSACHSAQLEGSYVLHAMGASTDEAKSSLRFSFGRQNTLQDVETILIALQRVLERAGYFRNNTPTVTMS